MYKLHRPNASRALAYNCGLQQGRDLLGESVDIPTIRFQLVHVDDPTHDLLAGSLGASFVGPLDEKAGDYFHWTNAR